jgi:hypothetical protein
MRKTLLTNFTTNKLHKFFTQTLLHEICVHWTARKFYIKYANIFLLVPTFVLVPQFLVCQEMQVYSA